MTKVKAHTRKVGRKKIRVQAHKRRNRRRKKRSNLTPREKEKIVDHLNSIELAGGSYKRGINTMADKYGLCPNDVEDLFLDEETGELDTKGISTLADVHAYDDVKIPRKKGNRRLRKSLVKSPKGKVEEQFFAVEPVRNELVLFNEGVTDQSRDPTLGVPSLKQITDILGSVPKPVATEDVLLREFSEPLRGTRMTKAASQRVAKSIRDDLRFLLDQEIASEVKSPRFEQEVKTKKIKEVAPIKSQLFLPGSLILTGGELKKLLRTDLKKRGYEVLEPLGPLEKESIQMKRRQRTLPRVVPFKTSDTFSIRVDRIGPRGKKRIVINRISGSDDKEDLGFQIVERKINPQKLSPLHGLDQKKKRKFR